MRVLHIINNLDVGGAETSLYNLLENLDSKRHNTTVISLIGRGPIGERIERLGIRVHEMRLPNVRTFPRTCWRFVRLVRSLRPQVIQGWMYHANLMATVAGMLTPAKVAWNIRHTPYDLKMEKWTTALIIRICARLSARPGAIIYNSDASADRHQALGYLRQRTAVIHNGFDIMRFVPSMEARASLRKELALPEESVLVGLVANFRPIKDHGTFLRAAAILCRKYADLHFVFAGNGVETQNESLMRMIASHGLEGRSHLLGPRTDISRVTAGLDVAASSSWSEGFSNSIAEGMACGVPCVATNVGDSAKIIGRTDVVVRPRDPEALAEALDKVLSLDAKERQRLGEQARQRVVEHFSMNRMIRDYERVYLELMGEKKTLTTDGEVRQKKLATNPAVSDRS